MRYHFLYVVADFHKIVLQPETSERCKTMDIASVSRDMPIYSPSFCRVLIPA